MLEGIGFGRSGSSDITKLTWSCIAASCDAAGETQPLYSGLPFNKLLWKTYYADLHTEIVSQHVGQLRLPKNITRIDCNYPDWSCIGRKKCNCNCLELCRKNPFPFIRLTASQSISIP